MVGLSRRLLEGVNSLICGCFRHRRNPQHMTAVNTVKTVFSPARSQKRQGLLDPGTGAGSELPLGLGDRRLAHLAQGRGAPSSTWRPVPARTRSSPRPRKTASLRLRPPHRAPSKAPKSTPRRAQLRTHTCRNMRACPKCSHSHTHTRARHTHDAVYTCMCTRTYQSCPAGCAHTGTHDAQTDAGHTCMHTLVDTEAQT